MAEVRAGTGPQAEAVPTPSPDKGRVGEGLAAVGSGKDDRAPGLVAANSSSPRAAKRPHLPYASHLVELARANRKNPSPAETRLWNEVLRHRQFAHLKFLRQKPIARYIVDFYCAELRLAIEVDGDSHAAQQDYDTRRTAELSTLGIRVLRYTNRDVMQNLAGVFDDLGRQLGSAH